MSAGTTEIQALLAKAKAGDAEAQFNLGCAYDFGQGVAKDEKAAAEWYRRAAEQGDAGAQCNLGEAYAYGQGVAEDKKTAVEWYKRAGEQGNAQAKIQLESMAASGAAAKPKVTEPAAAPQPQQQNGGPKFEVKLQREAAATPIVVSPARDKTPTPQPNSPTSPVWLDSETLVALQQQASAQNQNLLEKVQALQSEAKQSQEQTRRYEQELNNTYAAMRTADGESLRVLQGNAERLERLFKGDKESQQAKEERNLILCNDKLSDFYYVFTAEVTNSWLACRTIKSGKVENSEKDKLDYLAKGIDKLGSYIGLPGIKLLTDIASHAVSFWSERDRKLAVARMAGYFGGLLEGDELIETLGRQLTLSLQADILKLLPQKVGVFRAALQKAKSIKNKITANDIDTVFREEAAKYAKQFMMSVMQEQLKPHPILADLPKLLSATTGQPASIYTAKAVSIFVSSVPTVPQRIAAVTALPSVSPPTPTSPVDAAAFEALKRELAEHQEWKKAHEARQRAQEEAFLVAEEERRVLAEKLAQIQKQLPKPVDAEGRNQSLALATPEASGSVTASSFVSYAEFHAMRQHVSLITQTTEETAEKVGNVAVDVAGLQDKAGIERGKTAIRQMKLVQFENTIQEKKRQEEALALEQQQQKAKNEVAKGLA